MNISEQDYQYLTTELSLQTKRLELLEDMFCLMPTGKELFKWLDRMADNMRAILQADLLVLRIEPRTFLDGEYFCVAGKPRQQILKAERAFLSHVDLNIIRKKRPSGNKPFTTVIPVDNWIAQPLNLDNKVLGFILAAGKKNKPFFTKNDLKFLEALSRQVSTVLENIALLRQSEYKIKELSILIRASELGNSTIDLHTLLSRLIEEAKKLIGAQASSILLYNERKNELDFYVASTEKASQLKKLSIPIGKGIASWVFQNKKPVIINDVENDSRFYGEVDKLTKFTTKSMLAVPLMAKDEIVGVIEVINKKNGSFIVEDILLLSAIASQTGMSIQNARLFRKIEKMLFNTISSLSEAIEAKDPYTSGHSSRVTQYCIMIADGLAMNHEETRKVRLAGLLHDVGKIGISEKTLRKPGKLDEQEWKEIREHPEIGEKILEHIEEIRDILPGIRNHHEHYSGGGYPDDIKYSQIPLISRIISVADAYDAMISERPYRAPNTPDEAAAELKRCANRQFDPKIVDIFIDQLKKKKMIS